MIKSVIGATPLRCDACGASLPSPEIGRLSGQCEYCSTPFQFNFDTSAPFNHAETALSQGRWQDAESAFIQVASSASNSTQKASALYSAALARYGIQYVASNDGIHSIPVSKRPQSVPFTRDSLFQQAVSHATSAQRDSFFKEGKTIENAIARGPVSGANVFSHDFSQPPPKSSAPPWAKDYTTTPQGRGFFSSDGSGGRGGGRHGWANWSNNSFKALIFVIGFIFTAAVMIGPMCYAFGGSCSCHCDDFYNNGIHETGDGNFVYVSVGVSHSLAICSVGYIYSWGSGEDGRLGHGNTNDQSRPTRILFSHDNRRISNFVAVAAGNAHSLAIDRNGNLYSWGRGTGGRLGHGHSQNILRPTRVIRAHSNDPNITVNVPPFKAIAAGGRNRGQGQLEIETAHSMALAHDGTVWTWGNNHLGVLGYGISSLQTRPRMIGGNLANENIIAIDAGRHHSVALSQNGQVWTWGNASQLGHGTSVGSYIPRAIELNGITAITAGATHSLALDGMGQVWVWGTAWASGLLGVGPGAHELLPRQVLQTNDSFMNLPSIRSIAAGEYVSMAIDNHGTIYAWGRARGGVLGNGTFTQDEIFPRAIMQGENQFFLPVFHSLCVGAHAVAICQNNQHLWTWGDGGSNRLGHGDNRSIARPRVVSLVFR